MRSYKTLLQRYLKIRLRSYRFTRELTQEQMAELLHISPRAYYDLENEKYGFSALTLVFFLSALPADEAAELLQEFRRKVDRDKQNNAT